MTPELLVNHHSDTGENPLWDERRGWLFWCDIPPGKIYAFDPKANKHWQIAELGQECGAFAIQEDGQLLLLLTSSAALLNPETGEVTPIDAAVNPDTGRYNDCIADPKGRVFAGTVDWVTRTKGGLFGLDFDGKITEFFQGTDCSNGMGFTPDGRSLYWSDSTAKTVSLWDYDEEHGTLSNRRIWLATPGLVPDGMTVDAEGGVWVAFFNGPFVRHYSPEGELIEQIDLPTRHVTSCIFGGEDMDDFYITTAGGRSTDGENELSGALFRVKLPVKGQKRHRSRILLATE